MRDRRVFIGAIACSLAGGPFALRAQQPAKFHRVGFLINGSIGADYNEVQKYLEDLGYVAGKNVVFERRFAHDHPERLPQLAAELVALKPDVIYVVGTRGTLALKQATATVPIVMLAVADPVGNGFVESLARPGRNITGWASHAVDLGSKHLELLHAVVPAARRFAVLMVDGPSQTAELGTMEPLASRLQVAVSPVRVRSPEEFDQAFASMRREAAHALVVFADPILANHSERIGRLAAQARLPAISTYREHVEGGGLLSYGPDLHEGPRGAAVYIDKILRGSSPGDLPVQRGTKFALVVNLKAANALGLVIPQSLAMRADELIK